MITHRYASAGASVPYVEIFDTAILVAILRESSLPRFDA